jgi:ribokinase
MNLDVIGFGALNLDKLFSVSRIACKGEETFITGYRETPGGSAANSIVGLSRLGMKTGYIGKIADDREGAILIKDFRSERVNTDGIIVTTKGKSGVVMGYIDEEGNSALYVDPGVNDIINFEEIDLEYASKTKIIHLTSFVGQTSFEAQKQLVEALPDIMISFDPGEIYATKGLDELRPIINRSSVIFPNRREATIITGEVEYQKAAEALIKEGVKVVAVTLGSEGCYITDGKEEHTIAAQKVKVTDATGAGDSFASGFIYGMLNKRKLYDCGKMGNFIASCAIGRFGARDGLPVLNF